MSTSDHDPQPAPKVSDSPADDFRRRVSDARDPSDEREVPLWKGGYSGKAMLGTWILLALISVGLLVAAAFYSPLLPLALILILILWLGGGLVYISRRLGVHYQLTNQRFVHERGIVTRRTDRIEVIDIDDVTCTQGPIERLFGIGSIVLSGSDRTHPTLSMIGIADCRDVATLIDDTRRQERRRRSLHIEAI
jgi:membrane protein YdbS with pleckstrin-like domain